MTDIVRHLRHISTIAIAGELDPLLLGQVISFYTDMTKGTTENQNDFNIIHELTQIFQQCINEDENNPSHDASSKMSACLTVLSENASPSDGLKVLSGFDLQYIQLPPKIAAIQSFLTRGARESVGKELSGSLLRIQRVREERQRFELQECMSAFTLNKNNDTSTDEEESEGFIWPSVIDGRMLISKS